MYYRSWADDLEEYDMVPVKHEKGMGCWFNNGLLTLEHYLRDADVPEK